MNVLYSVSVYSQGCDGRGLIYVWVSGTDYTRVFFIHRDLMLKGLSLNILFYFIHMDLMLKGLSLNILF